MAKTSSSGIFSLHYIYLYLIHTFSTKIHKGEMNVPFQFELFFNSNLI
jgi:hypothetical protein